MTGLRVSLRKMIQRIIRTIKSSTLLRTFLKAGKDLIKSGKFFALYSLGTLYLIFAFILHFLVLADNRSLLIAIITNLCNFLLFTIFIVSVWIILELVAVIIEMKSPVPFNETDENFCASGSWNLPHNQTLLTLEGNRMNMSELDIEQKTFTETGQIPKPFCNEPTHDNPSSNLSHLEHFVQDASKRYFSSTKHKQHLRHELQTDSNRLTTYTRSSKALGRSNLSLSAHNEQAESFPSSTNFTLSEQKDRNIEHMHTFNERSASSLLDCKMEFYLNYCRPELNRHQTHFNVSRKKIKHEKNSPNANNESSLELIEDPLEGNSTDQTVTASEGSSVEQTSTVSEGELSWSEDSPTKTTTNSNSGNSNVLFPILLRTPCTEDSNMMQMNLNTAIDNDNESVKLTKCKERNSSESENSDSPRSTVCSDKNRLFYVTETTQESSTEMKAPLSCKKTASSPLTTKVSTVSIVDQKTASSDTTCATFDSSAASSTPDVIINSSLTSKLKCSIPTSCLKGRIRVNIKDSKTQELSEESKRSSSKASSESKNMNTFKRKYESSSSDSNSENISKRKSAKRKAKRKNKSD